MKAANIGALAGALFMAAGCATNFSTEENQPRHNYPSQKSNQIANSKNQNSPILPRRKQAEDGQDNAYRSKVTQAQCETVDFLVSRAEFPDEYGVDNGMRIKMKGPLTDMNGMTIDANPVNGQYVIVLSGTYKNPRLRLHAPKPKSATRPWELYEPVSKLMAQSDGYVEVAFPNKAIKKAIVPNQLTMEILAEEFVSLDDQIRSGRFYTILPDKASRITLNYSFVAARLLSLSSGITSMTPEEKAVYCRGNYDAGMRNMLPGNIIIYDIRGNGTMTRKPSVVAGKV